MAFVSFSKSAPAAAVVAQNVSISPWAYNSLEFGKVKLPNSFSFSALWSDFPTDTPRAATLYPDAWDFFEAVPVLLFVTSRDLESREVTVTAYPSDSVSSKLNAKLRDSIGTAWYDYTYKFDGETTGWSTLTDSDTKDDKGRDIKIPAYSLFGYKIVANSYNVRYISPTGATLKLTDSSQIWTINATQSLPDKTLAEVLYIACYMGGYFPVPRPVGLRSKFSARWQGMNLVKDPFKVTSPALNNSNTYVDYPFVGNIYNLNSVLSSLASRGLWLWVQWDSTVGTLTNLAGGNNGVNIGAVGGSKWAWFAGAREASDGSISIADSFGGRSNIWNVQIAEGTWRYTAMCYIGNGCAFWIPAIHGTPSMKIYFNTEGVTTAPKVTNVMCNIGLEPAPLTSETFEPALWSAEDRFGCDYVSVWDTEDDVPDVDDVTIGDEVNQASAGYVRYSEGWKSPLLGYTKTGRSESQDVLSLGVNGKATTSHLIEDGKLLSGLILLPRPEPQASLQMVRRLALLKNARKVSFTSRDKLDMLKLQRFMTGYCSITSAKRSDALRYKYEGVYYPAPTPEMLTTATVYVSPLGGTKMLAGIGTLPASNGSLTYWPLSVRYDQFGAAVSATLTVAKSPIISDFGKFVKEKDSGQTLNFSATSGGGITLGAYAQAMTVGETAAVNLNVGSTTTVKGTLSIVPYLWTNKSSTTEVNTYLSADEPYIAIVPTVIPFSSDGKVTSLTITVNGSTYYCTNKRCYVLHCGATDYGSWTSGSYGVKKIAAGDVKITISYTLSTGSGQGSITAYKLTMPTGI